MQLLAELAIERDQGDAIIQLLQGDLTTIPKEHAADILVISAYPGQYGVVDKNTLMAGLYYSGIVVADLAKHKEVDLCEQLHCWLSEPLPAVQQDQFNFKRILCFEPPNKEGKEKVVANIFRCLNAFAFDDDKNVIAMPVLASGNQKVPIEIMLPSILDAAIFWLQKGIPLQCIKLVLRSDEQLQKALPIFEAAKKQFEVWNDAKAVIAGIKSGGKNYHMRSMEEISNPVSPMPLLDEKIKSIFDDTPQKPGAPPTNTPPAYDYFISYSHKQSEEVQQFVDALLKVNSRLNIFFDKSSIPTGSLWIRQISEAIQNAKAVICILSPQYSMSDVCWDEFQCAKTLEYRSKKSIIRTINLYNDPNLPLIMSIYSYIDCTEGDLQKLLGSVQQLIA